MNSEQISKILVNDSFTKDVFGGVHAKDLFEGIKSLKNRIFIVNTDDAKYSGSHWVAFNFLSTECEFFDSYGYPPDTYGFQHTLQNYSVTYNNKMLQSAKSSVCGQYCILFLLLRCRGYSYNNILANFTDDNTSEEFDHIVNESILFYLKHIANFRMNLKVHDKEFLSMFSVPNPHCTL